jgi:HAD superfamily hydrolase (TIGR01509 family)
VKTQNLLEIMAGVKAHSYLPSATTELLTHARAEGLCLGLVTSSERVITDELLRLAKLEDKFHFTLTRDDCPSHKPDPWPYLRALELAKLAPGEVLIFEDSEVGLQSAKASGAHAAKAEWFNPDVPH